MFAVSLVLLLIIISARFVSYLAEAAAGGLDAGILLTLMAFRLPAYLELILPLGLFIGIMMAYGRMYMDSEMTVLSACGVSENRLLCYTLITASLVAALVAIFSLLLGPEGVRASETLLAEQRNRTDFETIKPARFHELDIGSGVSYAESISADKKRLSKVFMAQLPPEGSGEAPSIVMAESGETIVDRELGRKYLLLKNGRRYVGSPGDGNYEVVAFDEFAQRLPDQDFSVKAQKDTDAMTTAALWQADSAEAKAALHWRLSLPALVLVIALMAVPLSRTAPRKGRYGKLVPAILLYMIYLVAVNAARGASEKGGDASIAALWLVHFIFLGLGLLMFFWPRLRLLAKTKNNKHSVAASGEKQ